jgi:sterile alpha motif and leucine zipper-containing kinase AZK
MIPFGELSLGPKIGFGGSGTVLKGVWRGTPCAIKRLNFMLDKAAAARFRDEIKLLAALRHPKIIQFLGASFNSPDWYVVTEHAARGSLADVLRDHTVSFPPSRLLEMAVDGASGLDFLHQSNVVHRDLKTANMLVMESWALKICDFGLSRRFDDDMAAADMTGNLGTVCYAAPELLSGERYSEKIDVYSYAVCLWELATRRVPFQGVGSGRIAMSVVSGMRPQIPLSIGPALSQIIVDSWHEMPRLRPPFHALVERLRGLEPGEFELDESGNVRDDRGSSSL